MNFKTLELKNNQLCWIDQTKLPLELSYHESNNYQQIITAIKRLEVRGAPAIGIAAAYGLALALKQHDDITLNFVISVAHRFKEARPTAVNLFWAIDRMLEKYHSLAGADKNEIISTLFDEAKEIHAEDIRLCDAIGKAGAELIKSGDSILTHCNAGALATGGIGTALGVLYTCHNQGKKIKVFADETRPLLQGARLTTWELQQENIDVTLICDNTAGMLMKQGRVNHVIVGADRIAKNGDLANKIGTYSVAVLAKENNVPFYVAAPYSTFDHVMETGESIVIEERAPEEVTEGFGRRTAPFNTPVYSPAFDVTPSELVSYYITEEGLKPGKR